MKNKINFSIDGLDCEADKGSTILQAAIKNGIYIPNLCYNSQLKPYGACRLCLVENEEGRMITACENHVTEGMKIKTDTEKLNKVKKILVSLLIANHEKNCLYCAKSDKCKLQEVASYFGIDEYGLDNFRHQIKDIPMDKSNPFFIRDLKKCILCGICVHVCADVMGVNAIDFGFRGYDTKITTFADRDILDSNCVSCGECVEACPVGALIPQMSVTPSREVKTTCVYCGVGCGIYLGLRGNEIVSVRADPENPVNKGRLCVKGRYGYDFVNNPKRLRKPLIRKDGKLKEVNWEEALKYISDNLSKYRFNDFAAIASAKCTNEENYLLQKFTRLVMESPHIDHCARLCHAASVAGLALTIGSGAMTNSISEISGAKCILAIGTNTTSSHPILALEVVKAAKSGSNIIVINPTEIELCKHAELFLQNKPGTDLALLKGMAKLIWEERLIDQNFIENRTNKFDEFIESIKNVDLNETEKITGVSIDKIRKAAIMYASNSPSSILYAMGITQHINGTNNVMALSNLALMTGNMGKASSGINPLRGQNNVQGACDMGALPDVLPGYQSVEDPQVAQKFSKKWNSVINLQKGFILPEIFEKAEEGEIKAMYIMGENPLLSEPDIKKVHEALKKLELLIVEDIFLTETAKIADVVLPASSFAEKKGTFTNTERRVQLVNPALPAPGESLPDWEIISRIAREMGSSEFDYKTTEEIFDEITELTPIYHGMTYSRLENMGIQWPCPQKDHPGTPILHLDQFNKPTGKASFRSLDYMPSDEINNQEYPFILTTGRNLYQYHTGTMTRQIEGLNKLYGEEMVEINTFDADENGISEGDFLEIISPRGKVKARAKISNHLQKGLISMTFHFHETPSNCITNPKRDPISGTPELKITAVKIRKL
ncbi:MAG: formate dehydrogenase subunit alpha [Methanomicrobiales archaeon]